MFPVHHERRCCWRIFIGCASMEVALKKLCECSIRSKLCSVSCIVIPNTAPITCRKASKEMLGATRQQTMPADAAKLQTCMLFDCVVGVLVKQCCGCFDPGRV